MRCSAAIALLDKQLAGVAALRQSRDFSRLNAWKRETRIILGRLFGTGSLHANTIEQIRFFPGVVSVGSGHDDSAYWWNRGCDETESFLNVLKDEVNRDCRFGQHRIAALPGKLADGEKVTLYWLFRNVSIKYVYAAIGLLTSAFVVGFALGLKAAEVDWIKTLLGK